MLPKSPLSDIEASAASRDTLLAGFQLFPGMIKKYMAKHSYMSPGSAEADAATRTGWYPIEALLELMRDVESEVGGGALYSVGTKIPERIGFPAFPDIEAALKDLDRVFHMNHRRGGQVMFSKETGEMLEGIGHYAFHRAAAEARITMTCDTVYPCDLDFGLVTALARKHEPTALIAHAAQGCRKQSDSRCVYSVTW